jgi:hypothetical protein
MPFLTTHNSKCLKQPHKLKPGFFPLLSKDLVCIKSMLLAQNYLLIHKICTRIMHNRSQPEQHRSCSTKHTVNTFTLTEAKVISECDMKQPRCPVKIRRSRFLKFNNRYEDLILKVIPRQFPQDTVRLKISKNEFCKIILVLLSIEIDVTIFELLTFLKKPAPLVTMLVVLIVPGSG